MAIQDDKRENESGCSILVIAFIIAAALFFTGYANPLWAWLIAINVIAPFVYRHDKKESKKEEDRDRIAESILHLPSLLGGWLGSLIGMIACDHKTKKRWFQAVWLLIVLYQSGIIYLLFQLDESFPWAQEFLRMLLDLPWPLSELYGPRLSPY